MQHVLTVRLYYRKPGDCVSNEREWEAQVEGVSATDHDPGLAAHVAVTKLMRQSLANRTKAPGREADTPKTGATT